MKIEFQIKDEDVNTLITALEQAAVQLTNKTSYDAVQNFIREIKEDVQNGVEVMQEVVKKLTPYTDGSSVVPKANFRTQLGISNVFIESTNGLIFMLNYILKQLVGAHKPGKTAPPIAKTKLATAKRIEDLTKLILDSYAASV